MTETALALQETKIAIGTQTIKDYLFSSETKLSDKQQNMFMQLAIRNQLDPFKREIYAIAYGNDFNIVTGYQVYIQKATATGLLDGWECVALYDANNKLKGARITIYRKDFKYPFVWEVALSEFDKGRSSWKIMPAFMIKKVCIGQGFRLAFPNELGGMPYLQEELEGLEPKATHKEESGKETNAKPVQPEKPKQPTLQERKNKLMKDLTALNYDVDAVKNYVLVTTGKSKITTEEEIQLCEDGLKELMPPEEREVGGDDN